jgi:hypothetical protein
MNNVLKFSALALAAVLATGCSSVSKETVKLMKLWLLLKKHNRLLTKLTSALCACLKKLAASNSPSGLLPSRSIFGSAFYCLEFPMNPANKKPAAARGRGGFRRTQAYCCRSIGALETMGAAPGTPISVGKPSSAATTSRT